MKVSMLVPVYGVEKYIERCARSLFSQTYQDIEYIFVNDATRDSSIEILSRVIADYPERKPAVKIVNHQQNRGLSAARNSALDHATGTYIWHIDSDDYVDTAAVSLLIERAESSGADMVVFDKYTVSEEAEKPGKDDIGSTKEEYIRRLLHRETTLGVWGKFFGREIFDRSGLRFIEGLDYGEDFVMSPRLAYHARKIEKLDRPLYYYVTYNAGAYTQNIKDSSLDNIIRAVDILSDFFTSVPDAEKYTGYLDMMKMRTKIDMLKVSGTPLRKKIITLYPDIVPSSLDISEQDRLVLKFAEEGRWWLLDKYIKYGYKAKKLIGLK